MQSSEEDSPFVGECCLLYQIKTHYSADGEMTGFHEVSRFLQKAYFTLTHMSHLYDNLLPKYIPLLVNGIINYQMF